jgi:hypothetical protein
LDAWKAEKKGKIGQSIMSTALAVVNALATVPFPANIPVAGLMGVLGALQTAIIAKQKPPRFEQGGIAGMGGPELIQVGERGPELVLPANITRQLATQAAGATNTMNMGEGSIVVNVSGGEPGAVRQEVFEAVQDLTDSMGRGSLFRG